MSVINCAVSTTTTFQVLDPEAVVPPGSTIEQYTEDGVTQLSVGVQIYTVTFGTAKANADYIFDESFIQNLVDASPLGLTFAITNKTTTTFQLTLTGGTPDTVNYFFQWAVRILT